MPVVNGRLLVTLINQWHSMLLKFDKTLRSKKKVSENMSKEEKEQFVKKYIHDILKKMLSQKHSNTDSPTKS